MGIQFVQMAPENRAKLNQFLIKQSANSEKDAKVDSDAGRHFARKSHEGSEAFSQAESFADHFVPDPSQQQFDAELAQMLATARRSSYYQLLGVASDSTASEIKQRFYILARKFHPDHHMAKAESIAALKELMGSLTTAYKTLTDQEKRAKYDRKLQQSGGFDLHRSKTESQTILEESLARAKDYIRAGNFIGSIVWLRKCVEMAPGDPAHHMMLARSLGKIAQYRQEAIAHFQRAIELDPWKLDSYLQLAELYEEMELPSQALSVYSKILNIDPVNAVARERRSQISSTPAASSPR
jgi:curved DNA-binding protein CbpA